MNLAFALVIAILFGMGATLLLKSDLIRIVVGMVLISNAANLFIMASGLSRGQAPLYPLQDGVPVSDPLVQAMTLTAIVISFGITALLLSIAYRVYLSVRSLELEELEAAEEREEVEQERGEWRPI
ncbi:Multisubunit Na+/H+ antiporter MnhC subunit [Rubrobacter radiotolerans]|uniref:Multisubunit Na+/H+ antiporter MnhC subunit n=1 Tax=Rubrobacter radiotolerans TaxID=42256 RepID=A0A023X1A6_RUBRA|nr:NADH-quinone oxidoreductase subunit K [Rubrobacter radiotolerans]AHY46257.1 Multisubunit Na+/H+ antiporter MnhC subunit [Rubrobacter radiotolerans]MDX5893665.1 NADH-quinone oxidoreductase subunit K [Rubrobacter radiotolerans]SMC04234.1 multicomponent Na+:H+ antiporter subunit C [Rubrobacter radiotolerans DSM 5868]